MRKKKLNISTLIVSNNQQQSKRFIQNHTHTLALALALFNESRTTNTRYLLHERSPSQVSWQDQISHHVREETININLQSQPISKNDRSLCADVHSYTLYALLCVHVPVNVWLWVWRYSLNAEFVSMTVWQSLIDSKIIYQSDERQFYVLALSFK